MGGTTIESNPAPAPSVSSGMAEYVASLPQLYQAQLQYNPQLVAQEVALAQQYAGQMGSAYKAAQEAMYPETSALQEELAVKARTGMEGELPAALQNKYRDEIRANLGTNAGSGMGADYQSRNMLGYQEDYNRYYQNLGLSLAGRQPLSQPSVQGQANWMQGYTPQQALNYNASNYGSYVGGQQTSYQPSVWGQIGGGLASGFGSGMGMGFGKMLGGL